MGRPKKVKEVKGPAVKEVISKEKEERKIWQRKHELQNVYDYNLQEYAWAYECLESCKKDLEKSLEEKINFEREHAAVLKRN